jgi:hypothetical protein
VLEKFSKGFMMDPPKAYPSREMMLFIPTRNGEQYSNDQRDKFNSSFIMSDIKEKKRLQPFMAFKT